MAHGTEQQTDTEQQEAPCPICGAEGGHDMSYHDLAREELLGRWAGLTDDQAALLARLANTYLQGIPTLDLEDGTLAYLRPQGAAEALEAAARSGRLSMVGREAVGVLYAHVRGMGEREADAELPTGPGLCQDCGVDEVEYPDDDLCSWCREEQGVDW